MDTRHQDKGSLIKLYQNTKEKGVVRVAEYDKGKFFWIKLTDKFISSDTVDFLMSQKDGANYVVLYQMLCLKTVNNDGILGRQLGEIIVEYDVGKICRDCKYFSIDTVRVALELYKKLGLVYELENGLLRISNFEKLVGSKSIGAEKKKIQRENQKKALASPENTEGGQKVDKCPPEIDIEIEKDIEIYKDKDINNNININNVPDKPTRKRFVPPSREEVQAYCQERQNGVDAERFIDYYTSNGWMVGKNKMKDWKASVRTWERNGSNQLNKTTKTSKYSYEPDDGSDLPF
jgi:predicted phage replisome organizer